MKPHKTDPFIEPHQTEHFLESAKTEPFIESPQTKPFIESHQTEPFIESHQLNLLLNPFYKFCDFCTFLPIRDLNIPKLFRVQEIRLFSSV